MNDNSRLCHSKKILSKKNLVYINELQTKGVQKFVGPVITLDLTRICNYNCPYCIDQSLVKDRERLTPNEINYTEITELLKKLREKGDRNIELTGGGEPTLYTRFEDFCICVNRLGYKLALVTNGSYLHHYIEVFKNVKFSWVRVSLDAGTALTYSKLHGVNKAKFLKVLSNITQISRYTNLGISYIVCKENINEIKIAYELAVEAGAKYFEVKMMRDANSNMVLEDSQFLMLKLKEIMDYEIGNTKIIYPIEFADKLSDRRQRCWASDLRTVITPEGMYRCTYSRGGHRMPLPETVEEFIMYRNILNEEKVCSKECSFCTRSKLNEMVEELINNPNHLKKIAESYDEEEIEDEEWL